MLQMEFNNSTSPDKRKSTMPGLKRGNTSMQLELGLGSVGLGEFANQGTAAAAGDNGDKAQADDMFDEFLLDEDMTNLEVICAKWRGLEGFDVDSFAKICPGVAKDLAQADKDVKEFLNIRRSLMEKHTRKENIKKDAQLKRRQLNARLGKDREDDDGDREEDDEDDREPVSPGGSQVSGGSPRTLQRKKSFAISGGGDRQSRRFSVQPAQPSKFSQGLSQAGSTIAGTSDKDGTDADAHRMGRVGGRNSVLKLLGMGASVEKNTQHNAQAELLFERKLERARSKEEKHK